MRAHQFLRYVLQSGGQPVNHCSGVHCVVEAYEVEGGESGGCLWCEKLLSLLCPWKTCRLGGAGEIAGSIV